MTVAELDGLARAAAAEALARCCGATAWVEAMLEARPFGDAATLHARAQALWDRLGADDWREAFRHHPPIGDRDGLRARFASTADWAAAEQAGTSAASEAVLDGLAEGNRAYEARFGFIFIVCASGKQAHEMLALLHQRLPNEPAQELAIAGGEQAQIMHLRLEKLISP